MRKNKPRSNKTKKSTKNLKNKIQFQQSEVETETKQEKSKDPVIDLDKLSLEEQANFILNPLQFATSDLIVGEGSSDVKFDIKK